MMVFTAFDVVDWFDALLLFLCAVLLGVVAFVRFTVGDVWTISDWERSFASAEATGALPLDPAAFRKGWRNFYISALYKQ